MKNTLVFLSFFGFVIGWGLAEVYKVAAQPRVQWVSQCFNTYRGMIAGANASGSDDVQFFSIPSEWNYGGILGDPYCIIYKK